MKRPNDSEKKRSAPLLTHVLLCIFISFVGASCLVTRVDHLPELLTLGFFALGVEIWLILDPPSGWD